MMKKHSTVLSGSVFSSLAILVFGTHAYAAESALRGFQDPACHAAATGVAMEQIREQFPRVEVARIQLVDLGGHPLKREFSIALQLENGLSRSFAGSFTYDPECVVESIRSVAAPR